MNILITSVGRRGYLIDFFRQSCESEDRILTANSIVGSPGSLRADQHFAIPPASDSAFKQSLLSLCEEQKVDLLFSLHDWEAPAISAIKPQLAAIGTNAVVPDPKTCLICLDKLKTYQWATERDIPTPRSWVDRDAALDEGQFPFIVKPRYGQGSVGIFKVDNVPELDAALLLAAKAAKLFPSLSGVDQEAPALLISEWIEGRQIGINVVNNYSGEFAGALAIKKVSFRSGETEEATTLVEDNLKATGELIGTHLAHSGICDCDIIESAGTNYLIELNPRFGGQYPFFHLAGADVPRYLRNLAAGISTPELLSYTPQQTRTKQFSFSK